MTKDAAPMIRTQTHEVPFQEIVTPLSARALFWRPRYLRGSALLHHLPFLFWLADLQRPRVTVTFGLGDGVGHFALCQAMDRLGAEARGHGLDERAPDAGGPDAQVIDYNTAQYADFSQLHRGDPRDIVHGFDDGSVDLMLIDRDLDAGLIQSLTHDWTRKLSPRAVIVLHDTARRFAEGPGQGLLHSLGQAYPVIRFDAGAGLAAVLYGPDRLDKLERLAAIGPGQTGHAEVHHVFARLGAANLHEHTARTESARAEAALREATAADAALSALRETLSAREAALESRSRSDDTRAEQLATLQARLFDLQTAHDARAEAVAAHARALAEVEAAAMRETASRDAALIRERDRAETLAARLSEAETRAEEARRQAQAEIARAQADAAAQLAVKERALALATERLQAAETAGAEALRRQQEAEASAEAARAAAAATPPEPETRAVASALAAPPMAATGEDLHFEEIRVLTTRLETTQQEVLTLQRELRIKADQNTRIEQLEAELAEARRYTQELLGSTSWRVTRPMRGISRLLRRG